MPRTKRRGPRRRTTTTLSAAEAAYLSTGIWWKFLQGGSDEKTRAKHSKKAAAVLADRPEGNLSGTPYDGKKVRAEWKRGQWRYALGRSATEHPKYNNAVRAAQKGQNRKKFNLWWIRTWSDVEAVLAGCWFDFETALRPVVFCEEFCRQSKGKFAGEPLVLMDWQKYDVIMPLFGWLRPGRTRRFRRGYIEIPKKNGKSTLSSAVALYLLVGDEEPGAEIYVAAITRKQATIVQQESRRMVQKSPALDELLRIVDYLKEIHYDATDGILSALSADVESHEGLNIHGGIVDELHAHKSRKMFSTLQFGGASRTQPLFFAITTAGKFDAASIGWEQHSTAERVMNGTQSDSWHFFPYIAWAGTKKRNCWKNPKIHKRANPSYGVTIGEDFFQEQVAELTGNSAGIIDFRRYRLNIWEQSVDAYLPMDDWLEMTDEIEERGLVGRACYGGLDLSTVDDIAAWALVFPPNEDDDFWYALVRSFLPQDTVLHRTQQANVPYDAWTADGWITTTEGNVIDYNAIKRAIVNDCGRFKVAEIGYDPWNSTQIAVELENDHGLRMVEVSQIGKSLSEPTKKLLKLVKTHQFIHGNNPVLTWAAGNLIVKTDTNENVRPDKSKSSEKIDPIVATVIAMNRAITQAAPEESRYETEGVRELGW